MLATSCFPAVGLKPTCVSTSTTPGLACRRMSFRENLEAFQRLDSSRSDGLGLGLFIVRRAVELLGHRIEVGSTVGRGSRFSVLAEAQL